MTVSFASCNGWMLCDRTKMCNKPDSIEIPSQILAIGVAHRYLSSMGPHSFHNDVVVFGTALDFRATTIWRIYCDR